MIPSPSLAVCVSIVELALARPLRVRDELTEAVYFRGHSCPNGSRCCGAPDALRRASMPPSVVLREMAAQMVRRASPLSLASMAEQANRTPPDKGPSIYVQSAAPGARVQEVFMWERDEDNSWRCTTRSVTVCRWQLSIPLGPWLKR